ncbi:MAG: ATP-dependent Clp protease ATP-binding subunit [Candidatus Riflebacteria bacterium]|nr:ATP-dependent Clp protease ATP-binding subunit [Candidatus Riflebacteria bacterium]
MLVHTSKWIDAFKKQLLRRKHILLYGNIHDQCLFNGNYFALSDFLQTFFQENGFEIVLRYDQVDGFRFSGEGNEEYPIESCNSLPEAPRAKFREIVNCLIRGKFQEGSPVSAGLPSNLLSDDSASAGLSPVSMFSDDDPLAPPPRGLPNMVGNSSSVDAPLPPREAFSQIRLLLKSIGVPFAAVVELGDILTNQPDRYSDEERNLVAVLKKATIEASVIRKGKLSGFRNTLVILAGELKRVPEWLYMENPFVSLVQIPRPLKEERFSYAMNFLKPRGGSSGFNGGEHIVDDDLPHIAEEMADLTDGFQAMELEGLRVTSHTSGIRVHRGDVRRLVDFFKFGLREDPWENLNEEKVKSARVVLSERVIGQPKAVDSVVTMLTSGKIGISMAGGVGGGKPRGIFFFVGPTGVGKTELAKALTELVFGDEKAFARFDMSEYKEEHAAEKLAGAPPGFVGYEEGGQLTNRVISQPHSILLFDEIEKANPRVLDKFLQILEDGRLTDGKGQTAYFNQTAIIFTSNIGASDLTDPSTGTIIRDGIMKKIQEKGTSSFSYEQVEKHFKEEVEFYFASKIGRAELLSRLGDNIVVFDTLRPDFVHQIGKKFLALLKRSAQEKIRIDLDFGLSVPEFLLKRMKEEDNLLYGGRRIKNLLETIIERPLNRWIFEKFKKPSELSGKIVKVDLSEEGEFHATVISCQELI